MGATSCPTWISEAKARIAILLLIASIHTFELESLKAAIVPLICQDVRDDSASFASLTKKEEGIAETRNKSTELTK